MGYRISGYRWDNFAKALLLSLALHALVLSLQFGDSGSGLSWFGLPGVSRIASIPMLNAVLSSRVVVEKPRSEHVIQPVVSNSEKYSAASLAREPAPPNMPPEPLSVSRAQLETSPQVPAVMSPVAGVAANAVKNVAPAADVAVLSTDKESTWSRPAGQPLQDEKTPNKQEVSAQAKETPVLEKNDLKQVDDSVQIEDENAAQEAAARDRELALERSRADEQARLETMKAEQVAAARAREAAALTQQAADEALARKREADKLAADKAARDAANRIQADEQARIEKEKAVLAAAVREKELALERKRAEEQVRLEAMKAEQAAASRAREAAALAQQAADEALARKREADKLAADKAARDAAEKNLAEQQSRLSNTLTGKPDGGRDSGNGPTAGPTALKGSELAQRAIDAIRGGQMRLPGIDSALPVQPRRGSILGRDSKDIQLSFYGEGWRLKIERIGSMNYPTLSKNLTYDPLVVTVSINSDGTLAGVRIVKSSGHKEMDEAVLRIVTMSAPFSQFPPAMKRVYDVVDITRTWIFQEFRPSIVDQ